MVNWQSTDGDAKTQKLLRQLVGGFALLIIANLLVFLPLRMVLLLFGMAAGAVLLLRWPWLIWLLLGATLPVTSSITIGPLSATDLLFGTATGLWFLDGCRRQSLRLASTPLLLPLLLFIAVQCASLVGASNLVEAAAEVVKWAIVLAAIVLLPQMMTVQKRQWLVVALLLGGVGQALLGLYQFVYQIGPPWFVILGRFMRASGSFAQPNPFAGYLGLTLPVAASLALWALLERGEPEQPHRAGAVRKLQVRRVLQRWLPVLFYGGAAALIGAGLLASWSRGGWLAAMAGAAVIVALRNRWTVLMSGAAALLLAGLLLVGSFNAAFIPAPVQARLGDIPQYLGVTNVLDQPVTDENFAVVERVAHWVAALRMWKIAPWLGIGPGNYETIYPDVRLLRWEEPLGHAHNIYLNLLGETGLLGLTAYFLLWAWTIGWVWQWRRRAERVGDHYAQALALGVLGVIAHLSIHNFFDNLYVQGMYLHIGLWLAALHIGSEDSYLTDVRKTR